MKFIMVPVDFSETSISASKYAMGLAAEMGAKVLFIHVDTNAMVQPTEDYHPLHDRDSPSEMNYGFIAKALDDRLAQHATEMKEFGRDASEVFYVLKQGKLTDTLEAVAKENDVDLIIMGTQGASGWKKTFVGSNTTDVIEDLSIPVLAVPNNAIYKDVKRILYAEDLKENEVPSVKQLETIADSMDAELLVLHVNDGDNEDLSLDHVQKLFRDYSKYRKLSFFEVHDEDILEGIESAAKETKADIIAMQTRSRGFFDKIFDKSLTKKLAYHTDVPLLALHL